MSASLTDLLHLVDRAERGCLLAEEVRQLRDGLRAWDAERRAVRGAAAPSEALDGPVSAERPDSGALDVRGPGRASGARTAARGVGTPGLDAGNGPQSPANGPVVPAGQPAPFGAFVQDPADGKGQL